MDLQRRRRCSDSDDSGVVPVLYRVREWTDEWMKWMKLNLAAAGALGATQPGRLSLSLCVAAVGASGCSGARPRASAQQHDVGLRSDSKIHMDSTEDRSNRGDRRSRIWYQKLAQVSRVWLCHAFLRKSFSGTSLLHRIQHSSILHRKLVCTWPKLCGLIARSCITCITFLTQETCVSFWYKNRDRVSLTPIRLMSAAAAAAANDDEVTS